MKLTKQRTDLYAPIKCCKCHRTIKKGEYYQTGVGDYEQCADCATVKK